MADNVELDAGSGGATIATDDVAGAQFQRVKLDIGGDGASSPVVSGNPLPVAGAVTVSGVATAAKQDTAQTALDAIAASVAGTLTVGSHAVTNAGTFAVQSASTLAAETTKIIGTVNIAAAQTVATVTAVTAITNALPAGTNAIGKLAANSGVDIGDVDVTSLPNVTLAAGTNTNEVVGDAAHDAAAAGNPLLQGAYASAAAPADVSGDGDAVRIWALRNGSQVVNLAAAGALIGATSNALDVNIKSGAGSGGTATADDADFTAGTTAGTIMQGVYESSPTSVTDGDVGAVGITQTRAVKVAITSGGVSGIVDDAAFTAGSSEGVLMMGVASADTVDANDAGAIAMTTARELKVQLSAGTNTNEVVGDAAHDAAAAGNPVLAGAYASAAAPSDVSADADAVRVWALRNGSQVVNLAYGGTLITSTTVQETVGDVADDAATAGNPVLIGGVAVETDGTDPTTVSAEGDAAYLRTDRARRLLVSDVHPRSFFTSADYSSAQTNASVQAAPGASLSLYITDIVISNGATAGNITLLDGSGGTVKFEIYPAINGGVCISLRNPIRLTANTALCITSSTVTTHSINVGGYTAP